jgi:hypothetical protein
MKYMTIEHMEKLDAIKLKKYFIDCVGKLEKIAYKNAFEENTENYYKFVEHVYAVAKKYNMDNKKYAFSLMLLWHVEGDIITKEEKFLEVLQSKELHSHEKSEYFKNRAIERMKGESV